MKVIDISKTYLCPWHLSCNVIEEKSQTNMKKKSTYHRTVRLAPRVAHGRWHHLCVVVMVADGGGC